MDIEVYDFGEKYKDVLDKKDTNNDCFLFIDCNVIKKGQED